MGRLLPEMVVRGRERWNPGRQFPFWVSSLPPACILNLFHGFLFCLVLLLLNCAPGSPGIVVNSSGRGGLCVVSLACAGGHMVDWGG